MKTPWIYYGIIAALCIIMFVTGMASAATTSTSSSTSSSSSTTTTLSAEDALAQVSVSSVTIDPTVFFPYEEGTIAVQITNSGTQAVAFSQADLIGTNINLKNRDSYYTMIYLGPGNSVTYTFLLTADPGDGTFFPLFTVASKDAGSLRYPVTLEVDSREIRAGITKIPDDFAVSTKDTVNVSIINPRNGAIKNIIITPEGEGVTVSPTNYFIASISAGSSVEIPFDITPKKDTTVTFHISYQNGNNEHTADVVMPVKTGKDKTGAQIVVNNIETSAIGGITTLKGDVTNNGLTDAKSVLVTVGSPATPVNPNPVYAIGNLEPDDFSSFEVTYTSSGPGAVPLLIEYKDEDGSVFNEQFTISTNGNSALPGTASGQNAPAGSVQGSSTNRRGMFGSFGSGFGLIPVTEIVIILVALIAIIVAWRKGLLHRVSDIIRKKSGQR